MIKKILRFDLLLCISKVTNMPKGQVQNNCWQYFRPSNQTALLAASNVSGHTNCINTTEQSVSDNVHSKISNWLPNNLSFLLWNARSLKNQLRNFQSYVYSNDFDVIAITETWLTKHIYTNELLPCGYNVLRKDKSGRGGGVLLAFKDLILFKEQPSPWPGGSFSCSYY